MQRGDQTACWNRLTAQLCGNLVDATLQRPTGAVDPATSSPVTTVLTVPKMPPTRPNRLAASMSEAMTDVRNWWGASAGEALRCADTTQRISISNRESRGELIVPRRDRTVFLVDRYWSGFACERTSCRRRSTENASRPLPARQTVARRGERTHARPLRLTPVHGLLDL